MVESTPDGPFQRIKRVWHDPVWSKVIATVIATVILGIAASLWAAIHFDWWKSISLLLSATWVPNWLIVVGLLLLGAAAAVSVARLRNLAAAKKATNESGTPDVFQPARVAGEPWSIETIGLMHNREAGNDTSLVRVSWRPEVVRLRMEGLTELLGSFFLDMTYHGHAPHPSPLPIIVQIYLATQITSRPGEPVLFEVGRPGSNVYLSGIVQGDRLEFPFFQLDAMEPGERRTFQVSNVRCNGNLTQQIDAWLVVAGAAVERDTQRVAFADAGLRFEVVRSGEQETILGGTLHQSMSHEPTRVATLRFTEGFPNAFKGRLPAYGAAVSQVNGAVAYGSESCCFGKATHDSSGQLTLSNLADFGTRLQASFGGVPRGVRLFVTDAADGGGMGAHLVPLEGSVSSDEWNFDGRKARELVVQGQTMSAEAVWQLGDSWKDHSTGVVSVDFGVFVAYESRPASNSPLPSTARVSGSFSPTPPSFSAPAGGVSSSTLPIPRFFRPHPYAPADLFRIVAP